MKIKKSYHAWSSCYGLSLNKRELEELKEREDEKVEFVTKNCHSLITCFLHLPITLHIQSNQLPELTDYYLTSITN